MRQTVRAGPQWCGTANEECERRSGNGREGKMRNQKVRNWQSHSHTGQPTYSSSQSIGGSPFLVPPFSYSFFFPILPNSSSLLSLPPFLMLKRDRFSADGILRLSNESPDLDPPRGCLLIAPSNPPVSTDCPRWQRLCFRLSTTAIRREAMELKQ